MKKEILAQISVLVAFQGFAEDDGNYELAGRMQQRIEELEEELQYAE